MADITTRLFQLTAKSPNLVMVGCDKPSQQQQLQNEFLSRQDEDVEVSFFAAEHHMSISDLRKTIFQQFTQQQASDYRLEMKDLFKRQLSGNQANVLCITQADNLPDAFVAELWRWVEAIEAGLSKDNIIVMLFGSDTWGEIKHQWLDKQSQSAPIFISAASTDAVGFDVNELEQLMQEQRAFFAKDGLFATTQAATRLLQNGWFRSGIAGVFLLSFSGILAAQYSEQLIALFNTNKANEEHTAITSLPPLQEDIQEVETATQTASQVIDDVTINTETKRTEPAKETIVEDSKYASVTSEVFAGSWKSDQVPEEIPDDSSSEQEKPVDFQVPDIISVSELDEQLGGFNKEIATTNTESIASELPTLASEPVISAETAAQSAAAPTPEVAGVPRTTRNQDVGEYQFDEELLLQLPNNQVVLQLSGMRDVSILRSYLNNSNLDGNVWIYQTELNGNDWYVVLHGDTFDSDSAARAGMPSLPDGLFRSQPFTKSIAQIRYEITGLN